jgi:hypothetical protein
MLVMFHTFDITEVRWKKLPALFVSYYLYLYVTNFISAPQVITGITGPYSTVTDLARLRG